MQYRHFDPAFYASHYPDLRDFSPDQAWEHYQAHGLREGRAGCLQSFREHFVDLIPRDSPVLEIGPFDTPVVRGEQVRYADVLTTEGLRARAARIGRNPDGCPTIHYPLSDMDLAAIPATFAAVVSSHCIEHQPDLIRHLQAVERLLRPQGRYFLIVPDKRYCFDHFLPASTIADVMTAYSHAPKVHEIGSVIEHRAFVTHNDAGRHWEDDHGRPAIDGGLDEVRSAVALYEQNPDAYIDVHAWQFTPASFERLTAALADLNRTRLRPLAVYETPRPRQEFCAVLG